MIRLFGDFWAIKDKEIVVASAGGWNPKVAIANLETPLIFDPSTAKRRTKAGPHIYGNPSALKTISDALPYMKCLSLANNHTMDFGVSGLNETIETCEKLNIEVVGASHNIRSASLPCIMTVGGVKIGVLARCETQFGISSERKAGVAPFNITLHQAIRRLKPEVDIVIVSVHAAAELSPWPSPNWQDQLRALIDVGADVVHGHHSHVPQGYESYNKGLIAYGLGNGLVMPSKWEQENTDWSLVVDLLSIDEPANAVVRMARLIESDAKVTIRIESIDSFSKYHDYIEKCNAPLYDRELLQGVWQESSLRMYHDWYAEWLGTPPLTNRVSRYAKWALKSSLKSMARLTPLGSKYPSKAFLTYMLVACESHKEVISTSLGILNGEVDDMRNDKTRDLVDSMMPWSRRT